MTTPADIFRNCVWSQLNTIHTCLPGIVKSFDPATNKATIQPALNKSYASGTMEMPVLENVPIMFPKNVFFPVSAGDYVLLLFSERSIDLWLSVGGQVTPADPRKFNLSDAIAIPGLQPFTADFSGNNGEDYSISFAGSSISIKPNGDIIIKTGNKVAIGNAVTEVLDIISQTLALISSPTAVPAIPSGGSPPQPLTIAAQATMLQALIDAIKGIIT